VCSWHCFFVKSSDIAKMKCAAILRKHYSQENVSYLQTDSLIFSWLEIETIMCNYVINS
jgi:hypothetical protein